MNNLSELLRARVATNEQLKWPIVMAECKLRRWAPSDEYETISVGMNLEHARLKPYLDALIECAEAADGIWLDYSYAGNQEADREGLAYIRGHAALSESLSKLRNLLEAP